MKYLPYAMMGFSLGVIHGLILWAAKTTFSSVVIPISKSNSMLISGTVYKQAFTTEQVIHNSLLVTGIADIAIIVIVISSVWWLPKLERFFLEE